MLSYNLVQRLENDGRRASGLVQLLGVRSLQGSRSRNLLLLSSLTVADISGLMGALKLLRPTVSAVVAQ